MPIFKLEGPDGRIYKFDAPADTDPESLKQALAEQLDENPPPPPKGGYLAALKAGAAGAQSQMADLGADLGIRSPESAQADIDALNKYRQRTYVKSDKPFWQEPGRHIAEFLGENTPGLAAAIGTGVVGGLPGIAGLLGLQAMGSNVERQHQEGVPLGQASLGSAAAAAVPEVALQLLADRFTPGLRQLLGVSTETAAGIANQTARKAAADYVASTGASATAQGAAMAATEALTRLQAGQPLTGDEATQAYGQAAGQGAALGAIMAPVGRYIERGKAQSEQAAKDREADAAKQAEMRAQEEAAQAQQAQYQQTPQYLGEVQDAYNAAQKKLDDLKTDAKLVDNTDPNAGQQRADANRAVKEYATSDEFKAARDAYRQAYPRIKQLNQMTGMLTGQQDPLRGTLSPELPASDAAPAVNDVVDRLNADPAAKQRFMAGEISIPGLSAKGNNAVKGALQLQDKAQQQQAVQQTKAELGQRQADLQQAANPQTPPATPGVGQFLDSTQQLHEATTQNPGDLLFDNPHMDPVFEQALGGPREDQAAPPPEGVQPQAKPDFSGIDNLYDQIAKGHEAASRDMNAQERTAAANQIAQITEARKQLDQYAGRKVGPDGAEVYDGQSPQALVIKARDAQEAAVRDMLQGLDELRSGQVLGTTDKFQEAGLYKGPGDKASAEERKGVPDENATPLSSPEQTGGLNKTLLLNRIDQAKRQYVDAALEEAKVRRAAAGQVLTNDDAIKLTDGLGTKFDELRDRLLAKRGPQVEYDGKPTTERISPQGAAYRRFELFDPDSGGKVNIDLIRDKDGNLTSATSEDRKTGYKQNLLAEATHNEQGELVPKEREVGPDVTDKQFIQDVMDRYQYSGSSEDTRPLEKRPFGNVKAALAAAQEDLHQFTREAVTPKREIKAVKNTDVIKPQYAATEAKRVENEMGPGLRRLAEYTGNQIDRALGRKDLAYGVRRSLEKAKQAIEAGSVSRDLLDAARELAARAFRGERVRERAVMRDFERAYAALVDHSNQRELPGVEPTAFERATARNFENAPQVKQARAAVDAAKKLAENTAKWKKEKLEALDKQSEELERGAATRESGQVQIAETGVARGQGAFVSEPEGKVADQRRKFLAQRQSAMDSWRDAMASWHFGDQLKAAQEKVRQAFETFRNQKQAGADHQALQTLKNDVLTAAEALDKIHEQAHELVDHAQALAKAMQDKNVLREKARLDELQAKLEKVRADKRELLGTQKEYNEQRAAYTKAQQEAEAARVEFKKRRDAWNAKVTRGLDLPGLRVEAGEKSALKKTEGPVAGVPGDWSEGTKRVIENYAQLHAQLEERNVPAEKVEERLRALAEQRKEINEQLKTAPTPQARKPLIEQARRLEEDLINQSRLLRERRGSDQAANRPKVKAERPNTRARGPVSRDKTGGGKNLDEVRTSVEPKKTDLSDNEIADKLRGGESAIKKREEAQKLEGEVAEMTDKGRELEEKASAEKDPDKKRELMREQREQHAALTEKALKLFDTHQAIDDIMAKASAKADKAMEDQRLRRTNQTDKEGQGGTKIVSKKAERSKEKNKVSEKLNKAQIEALKRQEDRDHAALGKQDEDEQAFRDIFNGRQDKDGLYESKPDFTLEGPDPRENLSATPDRSAPYHGMKLSDAAKWGRDNAKTPFQKWMFNRLSKMFEGMDPKARVWGAKGLHSDGIYDEATNHILVVNNDQVVQSLLHEMVHAATVRGLEASVEFKNGVARLLETARNAAKEAGRTDFYGLTDVHEFLAEANSHPEFQDFLAKTPSSYGSPKSLWTKFVEKVAKLFGLSKPSLLTDVMHATERAMNLTKEHPDVSAGKDAAIYARRRERIPSVVFGHEPTLAEKAKASLTGLGFRVSYVDRLAAVAKAIDYGMKTVGSQLDAFQAQTAHYFMRLADQTTQYGGQALTHGPMKIVSEKVNGRIEERYESQGGANMKSVSDKVAQASKKAGWRPEEAERIFEWMAVGERANAIPRGWERLHSPDNKNKDTLERTKVNPAEAKAEYKLWMAKLDEHPEAKAVMQDALKEYKNFNDGLIDFAVQTGAIAADEGKRLKGVPYAPFYRVVGGDVKLFLDSEHSITIGNIKDQPDLKEMVGGDEKLLPLFDGAVQNAMMLTRMGLRNKATMETAKALQLGGMVSKMGAGPGPAGRDTIHFKVNGDNHYAVIDSDDYGIPSDLIIKGMEGIKTMVPAWVRLLAIPADVVRKSVTRSPTYILRQVVRDPLHAVIGGALDGVPVLNAVSQIAKEWQGKNKSMEDLMHAGVISSNVFPGHHSGDMVKYMREIASGQSGLQKFFHFMDRRALEADAATRAAYYEDGLRKGLTTRQAQFRAFESQNFSRRGVSPGMQMLSTVIPFFNAQVQGLDVLYRTLVKVGIQGSKTAMPFAEQMQLRQKLWKRASMLTAATVAYTAVMMDDPDYRKIPPQQRYQNFMIPNPFGEDYIRLPVPYELGVIFKSLPEAILDLAMTDTTVKEAATGLALVAKNSLPLLSPAAVMPIIEYEFNYSGFGPLETTREQQMAARERYRDNTSEVAKWLGQYTGEANISPLAIEHFVRGYTGPLGMAAIHILDGAMRDEGNEPASRTAADSPLMGAAFQRKEGRYVIDRAYDRWQQIVEAQKTYKNMVDNGEKANAEQYRQDKANELALAPFAGVFHQQMGAMSALERQIRNHPTMPQDQKDARLKLIHERQNALGKAFFERTTAR